MNTISAKISKSIVNDNTERAKVYADAIQRMMRDHGFRKVRVKAVIDENEKLTIEQTQGSESSKIFFAGLKAGLDSGMATASTMLNAQAKQIKKLTQRIAALEGQVAEVEKDQPTPTGKITLNLAAFTVNEEPGVEGRMGERRSH